LESGPESFHVDPSKIASELYEQAPVIGSREEVPAIRGERFTWLEIGKEHGMKKGDHVFANEDEYVVREVREIEGGVRLELEEVTRKFLLRRFFFKGQTVVRGLPRFWFSLIWRQGGKVKEVRFEDQVNPLKRVEGDMFVSATRQDIPASEAPPGSRDPGDWFTFPEGKEIPPTHPLNPNKKIPVFVEMIDEGELTTFTDSDIVLTLRANGKKLMGNFIVRRPKATDELWEFGKARLPGQTRKENASGKAPTAKTATRP
jgi:hypothetical protein